jgi:hypothetical protein
MRRNLKRKGNKIIILMKMKKYINYFIYFLAIVGFISIILFIFGYRPVIEKNINPDWNAISSISTLLAVIVALFITKWQDLTLNGK